jgi:hypothetical protein
LDALTLDAGPVDDASVRRDASPGGGSSGANTTTRNAGGTTGKTSSNVQAECLILKAMAARAPTSTGSGSCTTRGQRAALDLRLKNSLDAHPEYDAKAHLECVR